MAGLRLLLVLAALMLGGLLAACGDNGDDGEDGDTNGPTATAAVADGDTDGAADADEGDGVDGGGDAFDDVPLPAGAKKGETITISGSELPFFVPPGSDVNAEAFGDVTMNQYEVDGAPGEVVDFYKDRRGDWEEAFAVSTDEGGLLIWTSDGGDRAVWIVVSEGSEAGTTELVIVQGQSQD